MKTLGELLDALDEIKAAELTLGKARQSILHGGNEDTMRRKYRAVQDAEEEVQRLRDRPLDPFIAQFF